MGKKASTDETFKIFETDESGHDVELGEVSSENLKEVVPADVSDIAEPRVFVYLGPSIRGIITNGSIHKGTRPEILKKFEGGIEKYPKIERLIVADRNVAEAKERLNEKKGSIYINYIELVRQISEKEKEG